MHRRSLVPRCPPLRPINLGGVGSDRKPIGIARLVAPKVIQLHAARRERIVVCFDREQRAECAPKARAHGAGERGSRSLDKLLRTLGV